MMRENINFTKQKILFPIHQDLSLWCKIVQLWGKYLFLERLTGDRNLKVSMGHKTKQNIRTKQNKVFFGKDGNGLRTSRSAWDSWDTNKRGKMPKNRSSCIRTKMAEENIIIIIINIIINIIIHLILPKYITIFNEPVKEASKSFAFCSILFFAGFCSSTRSLP